MLANTCIMLHKYHFFFVVRMFKIYSQQLSNTQYNAINCKELVFFLSSPGGPTQHLSADPGLGPTVPISLSLSTIRFSTNCNMVAHPLPTLVKVTTYLAVVRLRYPFPYAIDSRHFLLSEILLWFPGDPHGVTSN